MVLDLGRLVKTIMQKKMFKKEKFLKNVNILFNNLILILYCPMDRLFKIIVE